MLIMIVDDEAPLCTMLALILEGAGYETVTANSAGGALEVIRGLPQPPDLIVLDLMLPGISGIEFCETLQQTPRTASVPILVITAIAPTSAAIELCAVSDVLHKPFSLEAFLTAVARLDPTPQHTLG